MAAFSKERPVSDAVLDTVWTANLRRAQAQILASPCSHSADAVCLQCRGSGAVPREGGGGSFPPSANFFRWVTLSSSLTLLRAPVVFLEVRLWSGVKAVTALLSGILCLALSLCPWKLGAPCLGGPTCCERRRKFASERWCTGCWLLGAPVPCCTGCATALEVASGSIRC